MQGYTSFMGMVRLSRIAFIGSTLIFGLAADPSPSLAQTPAPSEPAPSEPAPTEPASTEAVEKETPRTETEPTSSVGTGSVIVLTLDDAIHPLAAEYVAEGIAHAESTGASALVIQLSTPGGLVTSTRKITSSILESRVPVVVYVSPRGAQAASAGFYILMSADIAAMAPGTNTGSAHPVASGGGDIEGDMRAKVEQDAAANIRALAKEHGRNVELAEAAVLESRSFTADEALAEGLIEVVAADIPTLLDALDGRTVKKPGLEPVVLATSGARFENHEMGRVARFLAVISHPQIALLLLSFGTLGLYVEFSNPGLIFPGAIGAILLILGFYALSVLPLNYAGLALVLLSLVLFGAEFVVPSFGILTFGGALSLILGALLLFRSPDPALRLDLRLILGVTGTLVLIIGILMTRVIAARGTPVVTGIEGLVRESGTARSAIDPNGKVFVHGELWNARSRTPVPAGARVEVVAVDGLTLEVRAVDDAEV